MVLGVGLHDVRPSIALESRINSTLMSSSSRNLDSDRVMGYDNDDAGMTSHCLQFDNACPGGGGAAQFVPHSALPHLSPLLSLRRGSELMIGAGHQRERERECIDISMYVCIYVVVMQCGSTRFV